MVLSEINRSLLDEKYQWQWVSEAQYSDSDEKAIAVFIPTFGPSYSYSTGVQKNFQGGVQFQTALFANQQSTADLSIDEATRTGYQVNVSVDLWKNLFGRIDRAEYKNQDLMHETQKLKTEVHKKSFQLEMRKVYWSIVANAEKQKIAREQLQASEKQLAAAKKRGRQFIADRGEVARYEAQVANRKATLDSLKYQNGILYRGLKEQLPQFADQQIKLGAYNVDQKVTEVLMCSAALKKIPQVPWDSTRYDEMVQLIEKSYEQKLTLNNRHSDVDFKFVSQFTRSGVDKGFSDSYRDFSDNGESGMQVGLSLRVPLGSSSSNTEKALLLAEKNRFEAERSRHMAMVESQHTQIIELVDYLDSAARRLKENSASLESSLRVTEKKLKQARVSINDLIQEQDALLATKLTEIDTKLRTIHTLLDYFKIFTDNNCSLNQVGA